MAQTDRYETAEKANYTETVDASDLLQFEKLKIENASPYIIRRQETAEVGGISSSSRTTETTVAPDDDDSDYDSDMEAEMHSFYLTELESAWKERKHTDVEAVSRKLLGRKHQPNDPELQLRLTYRLAESLMHQSRFDECMAMLPTLVDGSMGDSFKPQGCWMYASIYLQLERIKDARSWCKKALKLCRTIKVPEESFFKEVCIMILIKVSEKLGDDLEGKFYRNMLATIQQEIGENHSYSSPTSPAEDTKPKKNDFPPPPRFYRRRSLSPRFQRPPIPSGPLVLHKLTAQSPTKGARADPGKLAKLERKMTERKVRMEKNRIISDNSERNDIFLCAVDVIKLHDLAITTQFFGKPLPTNIDDTPIHNLLNSFGASLLHFAARLDNIPAMRLLLDLGANVNARDQNLETPLHATANHSVTGESAIYLISRGATIDARTDINKLKDPKDNTLYGTPLHYAALYGNAAVANALIAHGADVNSRTNNRKVCLHLLACDHEKYNSKGCLEMAMALVEHGADVNAQDARGETPLHYASSYLLVDMAELLLKMGANGNADCKKGTPFDLVGLSKLKERPMEPGKSSMEKLLKAYKGSRTKVTSPIRIKREM